MNAPIAILLLSTESVAQRLHDAFVNHRPDLKRDEPFPIMQKLWLGKLGKSEFECETQTWRRIAEDFISWLQKQLGNTAQPHPLAAELLPAGQGQSAPPLKNASGNVAANIASPEVRAALNAEEASLRSELIRAGNLAQERGFKIQHLESELKRWKDDMHKLQNVNSQLVDRINAANETIQRLSAELERKRQAENELIRDRDRLIHKDITDLRGELENERAARAIYSDRLNKSDAELKASQARERRLTERLAQIAGIVSDL